MIFKTRNNTINEECKVCGEAVRNLQDCYRLDDDVICLRCGRIIEDEQNKIQHKQRIKKVAKYLKERNER